jgi:hypothetical protein
MPAPNIRARRISLSFRLKNVLLAIGKIATIALGSKSIEAQLFFHVYA